MGLDRRLTRLEATTGHGVCPTCGGRLVMQVVRVEDDETPPAPPACPQCGAVGLLIVLRVLPDGQETVR